ncbi:MAG: sugar transferase [Paracoccaceae bacterium]
MSLRPAYQNIVSRPLRPIGGVRKRTFDILFSIFGLLAFAPIFVMVIIAQKLFTKGPIFFSHQRIGAGGQTFGCLKFRTMVVDAEDRLEALLEADPIAKAEFERDCKLKNDPRIIPIVGSFLRKSSLDEIPQFLNVLMGDMTIVGPRPVTERELNLYGNSKNIYTSIRPGITGLWQVSGRNDTSFEERVAFDRIYISTWSILQDLRIILRTVVVMVNRDGAY